MTSLLFQRGSLYSSGSTLLLFDYGKILARLARGVKPINAAARRFRRKVSYEMQARCQRKPHTPKGGDRGGIGGQVFSARA